MKQTLFTGSGVAIVTPFTKAGVDYEKLAELIEFHIQNGTDAIIACGTTGESATMPDKEHCEVIRFTVETAAGRIPVIAGTGSNDTAHCIELSKEAEKLGADGLLLVTPYYNKASQKGLIQHYNLVADAVSCPIILYNVPSRTGVNILPETCLELSKTNNIVAVKEASGNVVQAMEIKRLCGNDLDIYSGNDDLTVPLLAVGSKGVISVAANIVPQEMHDMVSLYLAGETEKSLDMQLKLLPLMSALFAEVNPIPIKTAMNLMGMQVGELRLPLCEMGEKGLSVLKKAMADYGLAMK